MFSRPVKWRVNGNGRVNLVFHQRNQGADNHARAVHDVRGKLVAERLPSPGGHQDECVLPGQARLNDLFLVRQERVEAKDVSENAGDAVPMRSLLRCVQCHGDFFEKEARRLAL